MSIDRYNETQITTDNSGKRYYKSTIFPTIPLADDDIYIYSRDGDRLDLLANSYYGDSTLWWIIAQANQIGKGSLFIIPGTRLRIPVSPQIVLSDLRTTQTER